MAPCFSRSFPALVVWPGRTEFTVRSDRSPPPIVVRITSKFLASNLRTVSVTDEGPDEAAVATPAGSQGSSSGGECGGEQCANLQGRTSFVVVQPLCAEPSIRRWY